MKKWFNTNYHYLVPEIDDDTVISLVGKKPIEEFLEAKEFGVDTKVALVGPFTFLKLAKFTHDRSEQLRNDIRIEHEYCRGLHMKQRNKRRIDRDLER